MSSPLVDDFIERSRLVGLGEYASSLGLKCSPAGDVSQPCPVCGGKDRFSINLSKGAWNCRGCAKGGRDALSLSGHISGFDDLSSRSAFLEACSAVLGEPVPDGGQVLTDAEREELAKRREAQKQAALKAQQSRQRSENTYRKKAIERALSIWNRAEPCRIKSDVHKYLFNRCGLSIDELQKLTWLRSGVDMPFYDDSKPPQKIHSGTCMVWPYVEQDGSIIGCHQTFIDLSSESTNYKVSLFNAAGKSQAAKKIHGSKKGNLIPIAGLPDAPRWCGGEGIENTIAIARLEGFREDTFYFAAGTLGNLAGPAATKGRFKHPTLTKADANGKEKPVFIQSPDPHPEKLEDGFWLLQSCKELCFICDGDSEEIATASAMVRACARVKLLNPDLMPFPLWPPAGDDWAGFVSNFNKVAERSVA